MNYKPQQRAVPSTILTRGGWLRGTLHVPEKNRLAETLGRGEFQRVTEVAMPGRFEHLEFLAVHRDAMFLVVPETNEDDDPPRNPHEQREWHRVGFLLEGGVVEGSLATLKDVRVSDFFANRTDFALHVRRSRPRRAQGAARRHQQLERDWRRGSREDGRLAATARGQRRHSCVNGAFARAPCVMKVSMPRCMSFVSTHSPKRRLSRSRPSESGIW